MTSLLALLPLAQAIDYTNPANQIPPAMGVGSFLGVFLVGSILAGLFLWGTFTKAGYEGWKSMIPIYNTVILLQIAGKPWWWIFLLMIPCVNFVFIILWMIALAESFGKGGGFAVGLILLSPIFLLILSYGSAQYRGRALPGSATPLV